MIQTEYYLNSMFYTDERERPFTRLELLERKITSFHDSEERMLSHVKNRTAVSFDALPTPGDASAFYKKNGLPAKRCRFIAASYEAKLSLFQDFQSGKKISAYMEKKLSKASS